MYSVSLWIHKMDILPFKEKQKKRAQLCYKYSFIDYLMPWKDNENRRNKSRVHMINIFFCIVIYSLMC